MSTPNGRAPAAPVFDTGNQLLTDGPAQLVTAPIPTPAGQRLALTVRTGSTTVTVFLTKADVANWRDQLATEHGKMNGLIIP
jgi:hypothetical protein